MQGIDQTSFAIKELARAVQQPTVDDVKKLKRVAKYLLGTKETIWSLGMDTNDVKTVQVMTDANWAAAPDRRSTSGGWITVSGFSVLHWSRTQAVITQGTCESEPMALSTGAVEGKLVQNILAESGFKMQLVLMTDSASAKMLLMKRGPGRTRHLDMRQLWLQEEPRTNRITVTTVASNVNIADIFTKPLPKVHLVELSEKIGLRWPRDFV